jgi:intracellular multiplication protein IcmO
MSISRFPAFRLGGPVDTAAAAAIFLALGSPPLVWPFLDLPKGLGWWAVCLPAYALAGLWVVRRVTVRLRDTKLLASSLSSRSDWAPLTASEKRLLVGYATDTGEAVRIDDEHLMRHLLIVGQSGVGKSVLGMTLMFQQVNRGGGLLFVDGKIDSDNLRQLWNFCVATGREQDFLVINPGDPSMSNTYNPILDGDPDEVAARVLSLIPSTQNNPGADHYRQEANQGITTLVAALQATGLRYNMIDLSILLMNAKALLDLQARLRGTPGEAARNYDLFLEKFRSLDTKTGAKTIDIKRLKDTFGGVAGRLYTFGTGRFGEVMNTYEPEVRLYDAMLANKIVYVALPTMGKAEAASNFGKMIMGDLRTAISWLQALPETERPDPPFLVFMDEQGSYATDALSRPYEQARSAKVILCGAIQTFANLDAVSEEFAEMVKGNTWSKIFFKVGTQETAVEAADLIGMKVGVLRSLSDTVSDTSSAAFLRGTPESSEAAGAGFSYGEREQESYQVTPDHLKGLLIGETVMTYGGDRRYSLRIPKIMFAPDVIRAFGEVMIHRRVAGSAVGVNLAANVHDYIGFARDEQGAQRHP